MYSQALEEVLATGKSKNLSYECSSVKKYRLFMQKLYPIKNTKGVVILNSLQVEREIENEPSLLEKITCKKLVLSINVVIAEEHNLPLM